MRKAVRVDARYDALARDVWALAGRAERLSGELRALQEGMMKLLELIAMLRAARLGATGQAMPPPGDSPVMRAEARAGVTSVERRTEEDGAVIVWVNGRQPVRLQRKVGMLLELLVSRPACADGLAGWCTVEQVAAALRLPPERAARLVNVYVAKLRRALWAAGENRRLVQRDRATGAVRFRLRVGARVTGGDDK